MVNVCSRGFLGLLTCVQSVPLWLRRYREGVPHDNQTGSLLPIRCPHLASKPQVSNRKLVPNCQLKCRNLILGWRILDPHTLVGSETIIRKHLDIRGVDGRSAPQDNIARLASDGSRSELPGWWL
jgi:hypothetical protein